MPTPGAGMTPSAEARPAAAASPAKADALARCCRGEATQARALGPRPKSARPPPRLPQRPMRCPGALLPRRARPGAGTRFTAEARPAAAAPATAGAEPTPPAAHPIVKRFLDRDGRSGVLSTENWFLLGGPIKIQSCCSGFLSS
jgi:hypothetical protein